jgi:6-phosphofructokinase 2
MTAALVGGKDVEDAFMLGVAAAVLPPGNQLCRREDVERLYAEMVAERAHVQLT